LSLKIILKNLLKYIVLLIAQKQLIKQLLIKVFDALWHHKWGEQCLNMWIHLRTLCSTYQNCMQWACSRVLLLDSIQWFISFFCRIFCYSLNNPKKSTSNYGEIVIQRNTLNANFNLIYKYKFHSQKKKDLRIKIPAILFQNVRDIASNE
jgi:hypothetical protein